MSVRKAQELNWIRKSKTSKDFRSSTVNILLKFTRCLKHAGWVKGNIYLQIVSIQMILGTMDNTLGRSFILMEIPQFNDIFELLITYSLLLKANNTSQVWHNGCFAISKSICLNPHSYQSLNHISQTVLSGVRYGTEFSNYYLFETDGPQESVLNHLFILFSFPFL